jgi:hypothetical protein
VRLPVSGGIKGCQNRRDKPDGKTIAFSDNQTVQLWDIARLRQIGELTPAENGQVWGVAFSADGKILASGGASVLLWDVSTRSQRATYCNAGGDGHDGVKKAPSVRAVGSRTGWSGGNVDPAAATQPGNKQAPARSRRSTRHRNARGERRDQGRARSSRMYAIPANDATLTGERRPQGSQW